MRFSRKLMLMIFFFQAASPLVAAQGRNEIAFSLGAGTLRTNPGGGSTAVITFSYQFHITKHFSAEGALDSFNYKFLTGSTDNPYTYKDDYVGAEAALIYHFLPNRRTGRLLPFVAAGIGKTTTDFTEIAGHPYYRLGAGVAYHLSDRLGFRLEVRDEIIKSLAQYGNPNGNLPSVRCGIVFRF